MYCSALRLFFGFDKREDKFECKIYNLHSADDGEAREKTHRSSDRR